MYVIKKTHLVRLFFNHYHLHCENDVYYQIKEE